MGGRACGLWILVAGLLGWATPYEQVVSSPDGHVSLSLTLKRDGRDACLHYAVTFRGEPVILESPLGLVHEDGEIRCGLEVANVTAAPVSGQWTTRFGERSTVRDDYNSLTMEFVGSGSDDRLLRLDVRVYDGGIAFRQAIVGEGEGALSTLKGELTAFHLPARTRAWAADGMEEPYEEVDVEAIGPKCEWPLTLEYSGHVASILEAGNVAHPRMRLVGSPERILRTEWFGSLSGGSPLATPWRVILMGKTPGELLERNDVLLNLSPPPAIDDSWVLPGKAVRSTSLTTAGGHAGRGLRRRAEPPVRPL